VAVVWPPGRKPILIAAFLTRGHNDAKARDAALAEIGRIAAMEFGGGR
jgi:beta-lactamase class A